MRIAWNGRINVLKCFYIFFWGGAVCVYTGLTICCKRTLANVLGRSGRYNQSWVDLYIYELHFPLFLFFDVFQML